MSFEAGQQAALAAAGLLKEAAAPTRGFAQKYLLPVGAATALGIGTALPMIGYRHQDFKRLQERVPEAYRPAALTGGAVGAAGLGAGGALAGHIALQLLASKIKGLEGLAKHQGGQLVAKGLGALAGGAVGHELGERAGLALKRQYDPSPMSELKFKLGI